MTNNATPQAAARSAAPAGPVASAAGCSRHLCDDDGHAPDDGPVPVRAQHLHRPGHWQHQPGVCIWPAVVGPDPAVCRGRGRPHRHGPRHPAGRGAGGAGHLHHAVHDHHGRADLCDWRAGRRWCGHGRAVRADGSYCAAGAAAKTGAGQRHRQRRWLVRPVCDGPYRHQPHGRRGLGQRPAVAGRAGAAGATRDMGAQRQLQRPGGAGCGSLRPESIDRARSHCPGTGHTQLPVPGSGFLGVRLSCGVFGHALARRDCSVRAGARSRGLVAGGDRAVQHCGQPGHGLGSRALAHEVLVVTAVYGAWPGGADLPVCPQNARLGA